MNRILAFVVVAVAAAAACGGNDASPSPADAGATDAGAAPTIANLTYSPDGGTVGQSTQIQAGFSFSDPDKDVAKVVFVLTLPDGGSQPAQEISAQGVGGLATGTVAVFLLFSPPVAGTYPFDLSVLDAQGHSSNKLTGSLVGR